MRRSTVDADRLDQDGFSLPEMIVAIALLGVAMTLILTLVVSFTTTFTRERNAVDSTNVASIGMNSVTKIIRSGTTLTEPDRAIFTKADDEELIMYTYLADDSIDPAPIRVRLAVDANRQLMESRWNATSSSNPWTFGAATSAPSSHRSIARMIIAPTAAELANGQLYLFTYLRQDGTVIETPVASADLGNIATVKVTMTVQADETSRAAPVTIQNRVGMPNLTASRLGLSG